jgi:hypothetical protein
MIPKWEHRFEVKPDRWVFHPTPDTLRIGKKIKSDVAATWRPPKYYFHLRSGGHVWALRSHLGDKYFLHLDISDFFGSVNRTRITRCLKSRIGYETARWVAKESTVKHPSDAAKYMLPYGFPQSPILASLALFESHLGRALERLWKMQGVNVSLYMDDIIVSANDEIVLTDCLSDLEISAERALFKLNARKKQGPAPSVCAFNINISQGSLEVTPDRIKLFENAILATSNAFSIDGMVTYVKCINDLQGDVLGNLRTP